MKLKYLNGTIDEYGREGSAVTPHASIIIPIGIIAAVGIVGFIVANTNPGDPDPSPNPPVPPPPSLPPGFYPEPTGN